ncbi:MAG: hypothetical protein L3J91_07050, partial [Thermoplasmata archaeon]|nr:hypothetical protein [Thermoplasmata archaeon]
ARIVLVVADRPHVPAIEKARVRGLPTWVMPFHGADPSTWSASVTRELTERGTELILLAGFLPILPDEFLRAWPGRVLNVHPSLLPRHGGRGMYGRRVHEDVLASGETESGVTVHVVTGQLDGGPVVHQERLPVLPSETPDSLAERLRPIELDAISEVLRRIADGRLPLPLGQSDAGWPEGRVDGARG